MNAVVPERPVLLREALGDVLRTLRIERDMTLREVSSRAVVSLGYLSELERGQKEASSELLVAVCDALDVDLSEVLMLAAGRVAPLPAPGLTALTGGAAA